MNLLIQQQREEIIKEKKKKIQNFFIHNIQIYFCVLWNI